MLVVLGWQTDAWFACAAVGLVNAGAHITSFMIARERIKPVGQPAFLSRSFTVETLFKSLPPHYLS